MQTGKHVLVFTLRFFSLNNMAVKKSLLFPAATSHCTRLCKAPFTHPRTMMTIQILKPGIQHRDHNTSKKFRKSPSASNSEYPTGKREPRRFHFSLQVPLLGKLSTFVSCRRRAYCSAQTSNCHSSCTDFCPPSIPRPSPFSFFFFHYAAVQQREGNNWPGQRTCLLSPSAIHTGIHTAQPEKQSRGLPRWGTPAPHSDAEDQL